VISGGLKINLQYVLRTSILAILKRIRMATFAKQFNYVYKITNRLNGMEYIGVHSTDNLNDGYFGSGKYLQQAIKEIGRDSFLKEIITIFDTREEAFQLEEQIVNKEYLKTGENYNLCCGGGRGIRTNKKSRKQVEQNRQLPRNIPVEEQVEFSRNLTKEQIGEKYFFDHDLRLTIMDLTIPHICNSLTLLWNNTETHQKGKSYFKYYTKLGYFRKDNPILVMKKVA
jgi:hypothetical protein